MIHHRVSQGSADWHRLRLGKPTASNFHRIITPARWQLSAESRKYALQLAAEILLNEITAPLEGIEAMERGKMMEPAAVAAYEFEHETATELCGFLTTDDGLIGASPDRLLKDGWGILEIKCPAAPWRQLSYIVDGFGPDYMPQAQGQILVSERDYCDRYAYHPGMPPALAHTWRDDKKIEILSRELRNFLEVRDQIIELARAAGMFEEHAKAEDPIQAAYGEMSRLLPGEMG